MIAGGSMRQPNLLVSLFSATSTRFAPRVLASLLLCLALVMATPAHAQDHSPLPATPKKPVVDVYHGIKVSDDYRWLEDWNDPAVREWSDAQNRSARAYLDGLAVREPIRKRLREVANATSVSYYGIQGRAPALFAVKAQPPKNQPFLVALKFDDFEACARHLVEAGYTRQGNLAILGRSNGGLLMGAALVQHPELYRAVVSFVGIYDMLRSEATTSNAVFNITEFGTVQDPQQFKALYAYSPYHHVVDGTAYPAVLFLTGANDPRVNPANSRKMTARLQAATSSKAPVLLRTSATSGHGVDTSLDEQIEEDADFYAFLFDQLGLKAPESAKK